MNATSAHRGHLAGVLAAVAVILVLLPDYDVFVAGFSNAPSLLTATTGVPAELIMKNGIKFILAVALLFAGPVMWRSFRFSLFVVLGICTLGMAAYGVSRLLSLGIDLRSVVTRENSAFVIIFLIAAGSALGAEWSDIRKGLVWGLFSVAFAKLLFAIYAYKAYGGVEMFASVASFAADGGVLGIWSLAGLWSFAFASNNFTQRRMFLATVWAVVFMIFTAALAASFRRENMFKLIVTLAVAIVLAGYLRRRTIRATLASVFAAVVGLCILIGTMIVVFGASDAIDRVFSVSSSENRFAGSNEAYKDDWRAWLPIVLRSRGLGVGPGQPYGVDRFVEETFEAGNFIPLHTGTYELAASFGIPGALFQLVVFIGLPLAALRRARARGIQFNMLFPASVASMLWYGVWPFGPPFFYDAVGIVLIGLQAGIVCRPYPLHRALAADETLYEAEDALAPQQVDAAHEAS